MFNRGGRYHEAVFLHAPYNISLRAGVLIHDNRMLAERAFYCYGIYPVEGIGVFRVPKNGDARNKKPPALRVETKRCTKKSPFRYNRVVQALL